MSKRTTPKLSRREFLQFTASALGVLGLRVFGNRKKRVQTTPRTNTDKACVPGWVGSNLLPDGTLTNWAVETDTGASGTLKIAAGLFDQAFQLTWNLGSGDWVQGKYTFPKAQDLSTTDIFGISIQGGGPAETANTLAIMFADVNDVFYGYDLIGPNNGLNQIDRWINNLSLPKKLFGYFFDFGGGQEIDWAKINRFFIVVKRPCEWNPNTQQLKCAGGGSGHLKFERIQHDTAANWPRQSTFEQTTAPSQHANSTLQYILSQQDIGTGLFLSWNEEETENPPPKAWLYDQALVLIASTRAGRWVGDTPTNSAAQAANRLVAFLLNQQKADGHWARVWNPRTGDELGDDGWVGDQAWMALAMSIYARRTHINEASASAENCSSWLAQQIDATGRVVASTEGNVDVWWAMISTSKYAEAEKIAGYLLNPTTVWDTDLQYWWRGDNDPEKAMDTATWLSFFARHPLINQSEMGKQALSFVSKTLSTNSEDGSICGLDGMGPVGIWNEGMAQYVSAGGIGAQTVLNTLLAQQNSDGSMPASTGNWTSDMYGWLTTWRGLAPTAWLYFALTEPPFPIHKVYLPLIQKNS